MSVNPNAGPKEVLKRLEKGTAAACYYLYGEEPFKITEFVEKCTASWGASSCERFDGNGMTGADLLDSCRSQDLFGAISNEGKRVVLVRDAHQLKETDGLLRVLTESEGAGDGPWPETLLLFVGQTLDSRKKLHQYFKKSGTAFEFAQAREPELLQWSHYLAKKRAVELDTGAADFLALSCEGSLTRMDQEIEKALIFSSDENGKFPSKLGLDAVIAVSTRSSGASMSELISAVYEGKRARSLMLADRVIQGPEEALGFVGYLTWAMKNPGKFKGGPKGLEGIKEWTSALIELDERLKTSPVESKLLIDGFILERT